MSKGLLTLQTDLKSLRYGSDKPYVTKDVNNPPTSNQTGMQVGKRVDDLSRITKMLVDRPGLKYLANEALLQQVGAEDRISKARKQGKSLIGAVLQQAGKTAVTTVKIVGSTLGQVAVNGTGTHFLKGFRTDTYLQPSGGNTRSAFAQFFGAGGVEGAPFAIRGQEVAGTVESSLLGIESKYQYDAKVSKEDLGDVNSNIVDNTPIVESSPRFSGYNATTGNPIKVTPTESTIKETTATPTQLGRSNQLSTADEQELLPDNSNNFGQTYTSGSTYTGNTSQNSINNALQGKNIRTNSKEKYEENYLRNNSWFNTDGTQQALVEDVENQKGEVLESKKQTGTVGETSIPKITSLGALRAQVNAESVQTIGQDYNNINTAIQDFRSGSASTYAFDYSSKSIKKELRVNLGDQGAARKGLSYGAATPKLARDGVNYLDIQTGRANGVEEGRDLAKFFFEVIAPSEKPAFLYFRAFIDSIDDSYSADWQAHKYIGRAENFYTYGGFDRDINISFNIAAATRSEMRPLYRKMVYLASTTAPTYGGENNFMRGTVVKLTLGSYFSQIPGVLTSVKYTVDNNAPWEIAMANPEAGTDDDVQELPMVLKCSITFKPIHSFAPQTGLQHYFTNPVSVNKSKPFF